MNKRAFGITGYSGSGKTTLLEALIPRFVARGLSVSLIKHTHHDFDIDKPGKDSYRLREAGCGEVMLLSDQRWVLMHEMRGATPPSLEQQLERLSPCDLVLVEGFKSAPLPKLEVHRPANGKPLFWTSQPEHIVAIASDVRLEIPGLSLPQLDLADVDSIVNFIQRHQGLQ
jgi:molybdopterin-guanine dinucleotide biosynthesis protein B